MTKIFFYSLPCLVLSSGLDEIERVFTIDKREANATLTYVDQKRSHVISSIFLQSLTISKDKSRYICFQFKVGSSCMQGWRVSMEDAHCHILSLSPEDPDLA